MSRETVFNFVHAAGITALCRLQKKNQLTVLNLHRVTTEKDYYFNPLTPSHFEALLKYVSKYYTVVKFNDLNTLPSSTKKPYLILSFDDGYYDFVEYALPLLVKYNLPCNHNIVNTCANNNELIWTHRLNHIFNFVKDNNLSIDFKDSTIETFQGNWKQFHLNVFKQLLVIPFTERLKWITEAEQKLSTKAIGKMMNWNDIIECTQHKVEIGSHTYNHESLISIKDYTVLKNEIVASKIEIEQKIKQPITILALPNGQTNEHIQQVCTNAGIKYILLVDDKTNCNNILENNKTISINRIYIIDEPSAEMFLRTELFHAKIRKFA